MERSVLITGSAGGIGAAAVRHFHNQGWATYATDRREVAPDIEAVRFFPSDVSDPESVETLFSWLGGHTGALHALVNNAAIQISKPIAEMGVEEWDRTMASNLRSVFLTARSGYGLLKAAGQAAIVNVSSVHAVATSTGIAAYAASKGGMLALTKAMAIEFAGDQIRVNAVLPGAVDTEMLRSGLGRGHVAGDSVESRLNDLGARTVMGRVGKPDEIASAIYFLADKEQSSFMTGNTLVVDGGATARLSTE
ncbi:MAG: SDR family oxidoreductase [Anaerolineales bacterium]|nr:SDR family oxidoreductase [Anaerolineales bacterium]